MDSAGIEEPAQSPGVESKSKDAEELEALIAEQPAAADASVSADGGSSAAGEEAATGEVMADVFRQRPSTRFLFGLLQTQQKKHDAAPGSPFHKFASAAIPEMHLYKSSIPGRPATGEPCA